MRYRSKEVIRQRKKRPQCEDVNACLSRYICIDYSGAET